MGKLSRLLRIVGLVLVLLLVAVPVLAAISNPTSIAVKSAKVFQNIFADDDILIFVRDDVEYSTDPDPPASETYLVALYSANASDLLYQRALNYYGHNIISIYLTPTQASSLTWGTEYIVRVMGNPSVFDNITEDVNMDSRTLSASLDYIAGNMETSRGFLGQYCIDTAEILEDDWAVTLVTSGGKLNALGALTFNMAVPGLSSACPTIYETAVATPGLEAVTRTVTLQGSISGNFTANETITGGTSGASATFIGGSQTATQIQGTHSGVTHFQVGESVTGGTSGASITVTGVIWGKIQEAAMGRTGARLRQALDNFGAWLGISGAAFGGMAIFIVYAIGAGYIFTSTGSIHGAILIAMPFILLGNFIGILPFVITWALAVSCAVLFAILFIMGRMA